MGILGARIGEGLVKYADKQGGIDDLCVTAVSVVFVLLMSFVPFVDWPAHCGGALSGLVLGLIIFSNDSIWSRYKCKLFSTIAAVLLFFAFDILFGMLFFIDLTPYEYLADVCQYYIDYYNQFGEEFVCGCEDNRLKDLWYYITG